MKFIKWLFLLVFLTIQTQSIAQTCYPNDSLALLRLFNGLGVPVPPGNVNTWPQVTITPDPFLIDTDRILTIDLSSGGLTGTIPDSLFEGDSLHYLTELNLSSNFIPGIAGQLRYDTAAPYPDLFKIDISNNLFSADPMIFVNSISNLNNLSTFFGGQLFGGANTNSLSYYPIPTNTLYQLDLNNNGFTDTLHLDTLLTYCTALGELSIHSSNFSAITTPVGFSTPLAVLKIYNNDILNFEDIRLLIDNMSTLEFLEAFSVMDENIPHDFSTFGLSGVHHTLTALKLSANNLTGNLPLTLFEQLDSIKTLVLSYNALEGSFPTPNLVVGGPFAQTNYYEGTGRLEVFDISYNNLSGDLPLDWLLNQQLVLNQANGGLDIPLMELSAHYNKFSNIMPSIQSTAASVYLGGSFGNRFSALRAVSVSDNELDFMDLYRTKKLLNFQQVFPGFFPHYVPLAATDTTDFYYSNQSTVGIGGVKRRAPGESIAFGSDAGLAEPFSGGVSYISNHYYWERTDTANIIGGTANSPIDEFVGEVYQDGASLFSNLLVNPGISATDPAFLFAGNANPDSAHYLVINPLDSANHGYWLYKVKITNDSFPLLELNTIPKKLEVGLCFDASGQPVNCQQMMIQYDPTIIATLSPAQQDSFKQAFRKDLGGTPLVTCLCGDMELWEISDTATTMLEGNSLGTKNSSSSVAAKPQLLSAGPNYGLLAGGSNIIPSSPIPSTGGNTSAKTIVAIIDSGFDYGYTPLHNYISAGTPIDTSCIKDATWGYNFLNETNDASDDHGHGTAVAGIVAGINQNNLLPDTGSFVGKIAILPLKYTDANGKGTLFHAACALRYAANYQRILPNNDTAKVRVINTSWGFRGDPSDLLEDALKYVGEECNILVVASAGNNGSITHGSLAVRHWPSNSIFDPADTISVDNVLGVGAINTHNGDTLASYSNFGNKHIDLAAQGVDSTTQAGSTNGFGLFEGTSFSAPQVARAAALLFDKYPDARYYAVKAALMQGVDKLQSPDSLKLKTGGRLNYIKADSLLNLVGDRTICSEYSTINVTKIENADDLVKIYPNPVLNELNMDLDAILLNKNIKLSVFNTQGQCLYHKALEQGSNHLSISTQDLPTAVYFIQLNIDQQIITKKFLKI